MMAVSSNFLVTISICVFINIIIGCHDKPAGIANCKVDLKKAADSLNSYYQSGKLSALEASLPFLQEPLECPETRPRAIEMKISIFVLLKEYENGYKFVDSVKDNDFSRPYKREMAMDYFRALEFESKADSIDKKKHLQLITHNIQDYIKRSASSDTAMDKEAYYDLYLIKSKLYPINELYKELDSLKTRYPGQIDFIESLKGTLNPQSTSKASTVTPAS